MGRTEPELRSTKACPRVPLSKQLWDLDWTERSPWSLGGNVWMEVATMDRWREFVTMHYASIFAVDPTDERFLPDPMTPAKARFLEMADRFIFSRGGRAIGVLAGHPIDWSTYYWRTVAFVPEYQGRGLLAAVLSRTDPILRDVGVQRVEGETAPTNHRQVRLLHRLGYCVTGSVNSERWGTLLRLTKFLAPEGRSMFTSRFCRGVAEEENKLNSRGGYDEEVRQHVHLSLSAKEGEPSGRMYGGVQ